MARRLIEQGVRFVQLFNGAYAMGEGVGNWDGHKTLKAQYSMHAPILHLLGLDHERLSYYHNGVDRRLTDVHGEVIRGILA